MIDRIENISNDLTLAIAADYGRITINNEWYIYEEATDSLIRCANDLLPQEAVFEDDPDERFT